MITTPDCFEADLGLKHARYPSHKPLALLHPSRFEPDPTVRDRLGIRGDATYSVVRLVAMQASHDSGESGMPHRLLQAVIRLLQARGEVFISSEYPLTNGLHEFELSTSADQFHSVLAGVDLVVGDSVCAFHRDPSDHCRRPRIVRHSHHNRPEVHLEVRPSIGTNTSFQLT